MPNPSPDEAVPAIRKSDGLVEEAAKPKRPPEPLRAPAPQEPARDHQLALSNAELAAALASFQHVFEPE